jgi:uncharacterized protein YceH (UPF0502 family)
MDTFEASPEMTGGSADVLSFSEARVLGCLMEKEATTPEYYPMTLGSLTAACNQKSNRSPVVEWDSKTVEAAMEGLRRRRLAVMISMAGSRGPKYKHTIENVYGGLDPGMSAILCELLLRNGQTVSELRTRTERMHPCPSPEATEEWAMKLVNYPVAPLAVVLPPGAGRRVKAYAHLLCGPVDGAALAAPSPVVEVPPPEDWKTKVEAELLALRNELEQIKAELGLGARSGG